MRALIATATAICLAVILCVQLLPNPFQFDENGSTVSAESLTLSGLGVYDKLMELERQFFTKSDGILGYQELSSSSVSSGTGRDSSRVATTTHNSLLPEYEDLLRIVEQLSLRRHGDDKENQKLLTLLYAATLSKIYGYTAAKDSYPMDPKSGYIFALQLRVTMLHVTGGLSFSSTKFVVARQLEEYEQQIHGKVKEVLTHLATRVKPGVEKLKSSIENSMESILKENVTRGRGSGAGGSGGKHVVLATAFDLLWQEMLALQVFTSLASTGIYLVSNNTGVVDMFGLSPLENFPRMPAGSKKLLPDTLQSFLSFVDTQNLIENGRKELRSSIQMAAQNKTGQLNVDALERLTKASEILENSLYSRMSGRDKEKKMERLAEQSKIHRDQIQQIEEQSHAFLEILTDMATEIRDPLRKYDFLSPKSPYVDKGHALVSEFVKWDLKGTLERMRNVVKLHQILVHDLPFGMKEAVQSIEEPIDDLIRVFDRFPILVQHADLLQIVHSLESMGGSLSKKNLDDEDDHLDQNLRMEKVNQKLQVLTSANVLLYFYFEAKRTMQQWGLPPSSAGGGSYLIKDQLSETILDFDEDMLRELGMSVAYSLKIMVKMADAKSAQNFSRNR